MKETTKCPVCGQAFDADAVRGAFNDRFEGKSDYDRRGGERLCYPCACLAAEHGTWQGADARD